MATFRNRVRERRIKLTLENDTTRFPHGSTRRRYSLEVRTAIGEERGVFRWCPYDLPDRGVCIYLWWVVVFVGVRG